MKNTYFKKIYIYFCLILFLSSSCGLYKKTDARKNPTNALERAKKNVAEGRGAALGNVLKKRGGTNYEFSTSNPMWRATLDALDFIPFTTVDYSGGLVITDWYSDGNNNDSIKITVRFLSNEIQTNSLKITVHQRQCSTQNNCSIVVVDSKIKEELTLTILKSAAFIEKQDKTKK